MSDGAVVVNDLWSKASDFLKKKLSIESFGQWFSSVVPLAVNHDEVVLGVSDEFFAEWVTEHFSDILEEALMAAGGKALKVRFEWGHEPIAADLLSKETHEEKIKTETVPAPQKSGFNLSHNCRQDYTFANFVVGEENRYAHAAASIAAKTPGVYNPLYIYGPSGVGKTHLVQAVANEVIRRNPSANVRYTTCEGFLNQYVDSLRLNKHSDFRNIIRTADILIVDDVHQLVNKTQLQEEFFNTFNTLYNHNKQIILTSDKPPCEIQGLPERLISRFASGVPTEMTKPSFETRLAILRMKQETQIIKLDDEILSFLASRITSSVRMLVGSLIRLLAYSSAMGEDITIDVAEQLLSRDIEKESVGRKLSIESIQRKVAEYFDVRVTDILSKKRPKNIAEPRMLAMYLSRKLTEHSLPEIGLAFGKNHATVIHAVSKIEADLAEDENIRRAVSAIQRQLQD